MQIPVGPGAGWRQWSAEGEGNALLWEYRSSFPESKLDCLSWFLKSLCRGRQIETGKQTCQKASLVLGSWHLQKKRKKKEETNV